MSKAGGRKYARDKNGRFASTGGGGGSKSASTRSTNSARAADLRAKGTTAIGGRVKAKGFAGGKGAQERAGGLRRGGTTALNRKAGTIGAGTRSGLKANAAQAGKMRGKASSGGTVNKATRMSKAPANAAKERYRELSGKSRRSGPYRSAAENRAAAGAKRSMQSMEKNRGASKPKPANKVAASPRRLNKDEKIAASVMANPKLRSDKARVAEMKRQGVDVAKTDVRQLVATARAKTGNPGKSTTDAAKGGAANRQAMAKASGSSKPKRKGKK